MAPLSFQDLLLLFLSTFWNFAVMPAQEAVVVETPNCAETVCSAEGALDLSWQSLPIYMENLPKDSHYQILKNTDDEYELKIQPNIGEHDFLGSYDFEIYVWIKPGERKESVPLGCTQPVGYDDLRDETFLNGDYDITLGHRLNYSYDGGPYSNPNPYDSEVTDILLKVFKSIRIGNCS